MGKADYMKDILKKIGKVLFWKLSIKPGRPMAYGAFEKHSLFWSTWQSSGCNDYILPISSTRP